MTLYITIWHYMVSLGSNDSNYNEGKMEIIICSMIEYLIFKSLVWSICNHMINIYILP